MLMKKINVGNYALIIAAKHNDTNIFKMLIEAKADINVKTNNMHSLDWAELNQNNGMIDYINNLK